MGSLEPGPLPDHFSLAQPACVRTGNRAFSLPGLYFLMGGDEVWIEPSSKKYIQLSEQEDSVIGMMGAWEG